MIKKNKILVSVIIPVYNEENRIENLPRIINYLKKQKYRWELIIIDDGSIDKTKKQLEYINKKKAFTVISYKPNKGKGFAIKTGMLSAIGEYRLFLDIDLSTPIEELEKFFPLLKKYDIVVGSRKMKPAKVITRQPIIRELLGKMFTYLSQIILNLEISDFTCGFKCFSKKASEEIFKRQTIYRWGFDPEILYIGRYKKFHIKEVPVLWKNDPRSKVKFPNDMINSFIELVKIRLHSSQGLYR